MTFWAILINATLKGQLLETQGLLCILTSGHTVVDVIKKFGGNLDFPKIKKLNKVCNNV